jgi:hypothetical protein
MVAQSQLREGSPVLHVFRGVVDISRRQES